MAQRLEVGRRLREDRLKVAATRTACDCVARYTHQRVDDDETHADDDGDEPHGSRLQGGNLLENHRPQKCHRADERGPGRPSCRRSLPVADAHDQAENGEDRADPEHDTAESDDLIAVALPPDENGGGDRGAKHDEERDYHSADTVAGRIVDGESGVHRGHDFRSVVRLLDRDPGRLKAVADLPHGPLQLGGGFEGDVLKQRQVGGRILLRSRRASQLNRCHPDPIS